MRYLLSLDTVDIFGAGTGNRAKNGLVFWESFYEHISAAGFTELHLPLKPPEPEIARSGAPFCRVAIETKYGSVENFVRHLSEKGNARIASAQIDANEVLFTMDTLPMDVGKFCAEMEQLGADAVEVLSRAGGNLLIVSASPEIGTLLRMLPDMTEEGLAKMMMPLLAGSINRIAAAARSRGIKTGVTNAFWGIVRGDAAVDGLMELLDEDIGYCPDTAHLKIAGADALQKAEQYAKRVCAIRFTDTKYTEPGEQYRQVYAEFPQTGRQRIFLDVGMGDVDFAPLKSFAEAWDLPVILESKGTTDILTALLRMRRFSDGY